VHVVGWQGAGSDGASTQKYAAYGMSKAGMLQLTKSLAEETNGLPVGVHTLSPGLVYTDLVSCGKCAPAPALPPHAPLMRLFSTACC
jgi:chlorophyll(ide) b reductase